MAGQIIGRGDKTWLIRVFLDRDPETGKRRYFNKTVHGTKKDAQQVLTGILRKRDKGTFTEPRRISLNDYLDRWLETAAKPRLRPRTYAEYADLLNWYLRPALGRRQLEQIAPLDIQAVYTEMQERGLSPRTVRYLHAVVRNALGQAVRWRMLAVNPATSVDLPRQRKAEMNALSPEQASQFLEHAKRDRWSVLFALALTTGMRPSEYLGLQWKDVNLQKGTVVVRRTLARQKGEGWHFAEPKTKRSSRTIPLPPSVNRALAEHKRAQAAERLAAGPEYNQHDLVFATATGEPLSIRNLITRNFKPILLRAGLPESLRLYDLRHSCATLLLAQGEHPKVVSERLGHASVTLTLDTYSHVLPTMQQQAAERLEAVLYGDR